MAVAATSAHGIHGSMLQLQTKQAESAVSKGLHVSRKTATASSSMAKTAGAIMLDAMLSSAHKLSLTSACTLTDQVMGFTIEVTCKLHGICYSLEQWCCTAEPNQQVTLQ